MARIGKDARRIWRSVFQYQINSPRVTEKKPRNSAANIRSIREDFKQDTV